MKKLKTITIYSLAFIFLTFGVAIAGDHPNGDHPTGDHPKGHKEHPTQQDMDHSSHGQKMEDMDHSAQGHDMDDMDHSSHEGGNIRNAIVDGYTLAYHLIDMREKIKEMKAMGHQHEMNMTHHLMLNVKSPDGEAVEAAKVGYLVVGPNKEEQKLMGMGMAGGFGADINFSAPGIYTVKAKVVAGEKKFIDSFSYTVK